MSKGLGSFLGAGTEDDNFTVLVDGNSTGVVEDLVSRTLTGTADADRERSRKPCVGQGPRGSSQFVAACHVIALAYLAAD